MKTPRDLAKDLMRPYVQRGWQLGDQTIWDCKEYGARIGKHTEPPYDLVIVVLRIKARECFEIFSIAELLKEIRDENKQLSLWEDVS